MLQEGFSAHLPEARNAVELAFDHRLRAALSMVCDREPVRLVADALEQVEALARPRQDDRVFLVGYPDLFEPLGQTTQCNVIDAERIQRLLGRRDLWWAAVDDDQARAVGELAWPARLGVDQAGSLVLCRFRIIGVREVCRACGCLLVEQATEAPCDRLVHGRDVVLPVDTSDDEPSILGLTWKAVLEHDHRRDDLCALQVRDVVALDTQRRLLEAQRLLDLLQRLAPGGEVRSEENTSG